MKRRPLVPALLLSLATSVAIATPAMADVTGTWTNTGTGNPNCPTTWSGASNYALSPGEIIKVSVAAGGSNECSITIRGSDLSSWQISTNDGASWTSLLNPFEGLSVGSPYSVWYRVGLTPATFGSGVYPDTPYYGSRFTTAVFTVTVTAASTPAPVLQQFGKPAGSTCAEVAPVALNWGDSSSGGWGESWAQWVNEGLGGEVCTRTLVFDNTLGGWKVG